MFRFTIRDVLLLTVIVGLALGWWLDRCQLLTSHYAVKHEAFLLRAHLERNGAKVTVGTSTVSVRDQDKASFYVYPSTTP